MLLSVNMTGTHLSTLLVASEDVSLDLVFSVWLLLCSSVISQELPSRAVWKMLPLAFISVWVLSCWGTLTRVRISLHLHWAAALILLVQLSKPQMERKYWDTLIAAHCHFLYYPCAPLREHSAQNKVFAWVSASIQVWILKICVHIKSPLLREWLKVVKHSKQDTFEQSLTCSLSSTVFQAQGHPGGYQDHPNTLEPYWATGWITYHAIEKISAP